MMKRLAVLAFAITAATSAFATERATIMPEPGALQAAIDRLPAEGGVIELKPGIYREKVTLAKSHVRLRGLGRRPQDVVIVWSDGARTAGGTFKSATANISGDDIRVENLTIQNDYWLQRPDQPSQAVALAVTGDRNVFERVRLLGHQDTLYAGSKAKCDARGCGTSRQLFRDCYIEGHVDFIFGDAKAYFQRCKIHALAHGEILLTAQSKSTPDQDSGYVFDRCRVTADAGARSIYLGRAWRPYATVIFMRTHLPGSLHPAGWREWRPGQTNTFETAYFAEHRSTGPGGGIGQRDPHSRQLTAEEARAWSFDVFMSGWQL